MNIWTYIYAAATIIYVIAFFYVIAKKPYSLTNWVLSFVFGSLAVWTTCDVVITNNIISIKTAEFVIKIQAIGWVFYIYYLFLFVLIFTKNNAVLRSPLLYVGGYILSFAFIIANLLGRMNILGAITDFGYAGKWARTPETFIFFAWYLALFVMVVFFFLRFRAGYREKSAYREISDIMLAALVLCVVAGTFTNVVLKFIPVYVPVKIELIMLTFVYAIVYSAEKYDILEITPARAAGDLMESVDYGIVLLTAEGIIAAKNEKAAAMAGFLDGAEGTKLSGLVQLPALEETMRTCRPSVCEIGTTDKNGWRKAVSVSCVPSLKNKKATGYICVLHDITDRKKAEKKLIDTVAELKRSNTELENFARIASHDLREPARVVSLYLQRFRQKTRDRLPEDVKNYLETTMLEVARMNNIVRGIFEYSRAGSKNKPVILNMQRLLNEAVLAMALKINELSASFTLPVGEAFYVGGDETMLRQLFVNLFDNAMKYRSEPRPEIKVSAAKEGGNVIISVEDNGIGIEPQYREKIFEMFTRLHGQDEYTGEGIGLALCKKIAGLHGGKIWAEAREQGHGSVFKVSLPEADAPGAGAQEAAR